MCGIFGIWHLDNEPVNIESLEWGTNRLRHRGPDDEGYLLVNLQDDSIKLCGGEDTSPELQLPHLRKFSDHHFSLGFGFRRLSILDLSPSGHQPMASDDKRLWIIFNGEVYNYLELRNELAALGYSFHTNSDTEVILAAYERWGSECLYRFNGMWGMAIWDNQEKTLLLARDRFGVKPVYYTYNNNKLTFASEIKALVGSKGITFEPRDEAVYFYLTQGELPDASTGETFFIGVHCLPPGHILTLNHDGIQVRKYWTLSKADHQPSKSLDQVLEEYRYLLDDAVRLRLRSDVPVGTCLSGGIDSSSIVCIINRLMGEMGLSTAQIGQQQRTFSAVYKQQGPFNELQYIEKILKTTGAQGNYTWPSSERLRQEAERMIWHQDEPFPTTSIFAQWCVMNIVRDKSVTVLLDGQGADEILAGYRPYLYYLRDLVNTGRYAKAVRELLAISTNTDTNAWQLLRPVLTKRIPGQYSSLVSRGKSLGKTEQIVMNPDFEIRGRVWEQNKQDGTAKSLDEHLRYILENSSLPHLLRYEDRNSMAFAIEARVPFLDYRFVEYTFNQAAAWRIEQGWTKYVLRRAMQPWVPGEILWRKDKVGFGTPEQSWLADWMKIDRDLFTGDSLSGEYISLPVVKDRITTWLENQNYMPPIWRWINLELWLRIWRQSSEKY